MARNKPQTHASNQASAPSPAVASGAPPPEERIAERAYEKWLGRGCPVGDDLRDWFEALAELGSGKRDEASASG